LAKKLYLGHYEILFNMSPGYEWKHSSGSKYDAIGRCPGQPNRYAVRLQLSDDESHKLGIWDAERKWAVVYTILESREFLGEMNYEGKVFEFDEPLPDPTIAFTDFVELNHSKRLRKNS